MQESKLVPFITKLDQLLHFSKDARKAYRLTKDGRETFAVLSTDDLVLMELVDDGWTVAEEIDFSKAE